MFAVRRPEFVTSAAVAVTMASLYVVVLNEPGRRELFGAAAVLGAGLLALASARMRWLRAVLLAFAGGVAVALTSRDYFSFWPAASALLFLAALVPGERERRAPFYLAGVAALGGLLWAGLRPGGDVAPPLLPIAVAIVALMMERFAWTLERRARELEVEASRLRRRAETSEAQKDEIERRSTLARELHDSIGHHVTAMVVQAEAGRVKEASKALERIADLGREALDELEVVLFQLGRPDGETPQGEALDLERIDAKLAQPLREQGVTVEVSVNTSESEPARLAAIYRIIQEALTNTMRHARATNVSVVVSDSAQDVLVSVRDNGIGLPRSASHGRGLAGISERAKRLGGEAVASDASPTGTVIRARIPRSNE